LTSTIEKFRLAGMSSPGSAEGDERIARGKKLAAASDLALATLYLNDNVNKPQEALNILKAYDDKYPDDREGIAQAAFLALWAYRKLGDLDGAEKQLQALAKEYADHEQWPSAMKAVALDLDAEARRRLQKGDTKGSNDLKARAVAVYEDFIRWATGRAGTEKDVSQFQLRLAECYLPLENWTSGIALYQELIKQYPAAINLREGLAGCYEGAGKHQDALKAWRGIEEGTKPGTDPWWNAKYHIVLMHKQLGNKSNALEIIRVTRLLRPTLGGPELKKKFEEIERACQ
ncbi:MAG: tetratricopeptide repeat protein, partial [Planctomycetes bacterium]|nr:tetratricopeptide repeat protein [Planctomycetota bacterium]